MNSRKYQRTPPPSQKWTQKHQVDVIIAGQESCIARNTTSDFFAADSESNVDPYAIAFGTNPADLTRKQLLKWATLLPNVNKNKNRTTTDDLRKIYRSIEAQQIERARLAAIEFENRLSIEVRSKLCCKRGEMPR